MWHATQHVARDKRSMCCTWFAHDCAQSTWAFVLETVCGAVRRLSKISNCAFECDYCDVIIVVIVVNIIIILVIIIIIIIIIVVIIVIIIIIINCWYCDRWGHCTTEVWERPRSMTSLKLWRTTTRHWKSMTKTRPSFTPAPWPFCRWETSVRPWWTPRTSSALSRTAPRCLWFSVLSTSSV